MMVVAEEKHEENKVDKDKDKEENEKMITFSSLLNEDQSKCRTQDPSFLVDKIQLYKKVHVSRKDNIIQSHYQR